MRLLAIETEAATEPAPGPVEKVTHFDFKRHFAPPEIKYVVEEKLEACLPYCERLALFEKENRQGGVTMVAISGNTFPVKDELKALGGKWDADSKCWKVPDDKAQEAQALVAGAPKQKYDASKKYNGPKKCKVCGHVEQKQGRYPDPDRILKSGECVSCYEERKMGY